MKPTIRSAVAVSLLVQGAGSIFPFLTIIALAQVGGPEVQGTFSTFKTWSDLVSSIFVFGFPQAFIYLINKGLAKRDQLLNFSIFYSFACFALSVPLAMYSVWSGYNSMPQGRDIVLFALLVSVGIFSIVFNRLVRAIYLTLDDGLSFAAITTAPAVFVFAFVTGYATFGNFLYDVAFFLAGLLAIAATFVWVRRIVGSTPGYRLKFEAPTRRSLAEQSIQSFLQALAFAAQPVATIYLIQLYRGDSDAVAFFTSSTLVVTSVNLVFAIVAPILFNRWSAALDPALLRRIQRSGLVLSAIFLGLGLIAAYLMPFIVPLVFGADYTPAIWAFQAVSLAMAPVAFTRILSPAIHAAGRPATNTVSCATRLGLSVALQLALASSGLASPLAAAVWAWVIAEWGAAFYSFWAARRMPRWIS